MEENDLVHRKVYAEVPPRVEYSLTELGQSLKPIHDAMWSWGDEYKAKMDRFKVIIRYLIITVLAYTYLEILALPKQRTF